MMKNPLKNYLTNDEQTILGFLVFFALLGLGLKFTGVMAESSSAASDSLDFKKDYEIKYDLRTVSAAELKTIPGIGEKKAKDVVEYRQKYGFRAKTDLMKIKGIGKVTYAKWEKYFLDFGSPQDYTETSEAAAPDKTIPVSKPKNTPKFPININTATLKDLTALKGIGPAKAERILKLREELGGFSEVKQLLQVKGIGAKTLRKLESNISLGESNGRN